MHQAHGSHQPIKVSQNGQDAYRKCTGLPGPTQIHSRRPLVRSLSLRPEPHYLLLVVQRAVAYPADVFGE